jgi:hypothetical protein
VSGIYRVRVEAGDNVFTAYQGDSSTQAMKAIDIARAVLIMSGGTAAIWLNESGGGLGERPPDRLAWTVAGGSAAAGPAAPWIVKGAAK